MRGIKDLRSYQKQTCNFIIKTPKNFLMISMGLGKTVSVLTVFNELKYNRFEIFNALVIAPPRVALNTWPDEVAEWEHLRHLTVTPIAGTAKKRKELLKETTDIHTISVDNVKWLCEVFPGRLPYDWVIFDESSCFKSPDSVRFKMIKNRLSKCRVSLLTGTPASNGAQDLWSQTYLLDRGERLGKTVTAFRNKYCNAETIFGTRARKYSVNENMTDLIMSKISDITISLKTEDYLKLPEVQFIDAPVIMSANVREQYEEFKREKVLELLESEEPITVANANALTTKLRQFANGFVYQKNELGENVPYDVHSLKIEALEEIIEAAQGSPMICAYVHTYDRDRILNHFKKLKPRVLGKGDQGRQDIKDWNAGKIKLFLMHPASGGHGLNLQFGGHILVFFGLDWRLELYQQIVKRIHRSGQKNPFVLVYRILCKDTIDTRIKDALEGKAKSQDSMIDYVKDTIKEYTKIYKDS